MSQENPESVRSGLAQVRASGEIHARIVVPDFVWGMSKLRGWPERRGYWSAR